MIQQQSANLFCKSRFQRQILQHAFFLDVMCNKSLFCWLNSPNFFIRWMGKLFFSRANNLTFQKGLTLLGLTIKELFSQFCQYYSLYQKIFKKSFVALVEAQMLLPFNFGRKVSRNFVNVADARARVATLPRQSGSTIVARPGM